VHQAAFTLRPAEAADHEFLQTLIREAFSELVVQQYGPWNDAEQRRRLSEKLRCVAYRIVELDGSRVGAIASTVNADHVFLDDLVILPARQRRGLGAALLRAELAQARALGKPLRLHVPLMSRAVTFYERHGFVEIGRDENYITLESPAA
jgi:ribosomal protein S18 acetylase RimI-like enzyme